MRTVSAAWYVPAEIVSSIVIAALFGVVAAACADLSPTWLGLLLGGLVLLTVIFWSKDIKTTLLCCVFLAAPIDIQKSIISANWKIAPGVTVYPPDVFILPLIAVWLWDMLVVRKERYQTPYGFGIATAFWLWCWVTGLASEEYYDGALSAINYTRYYVIYLVLADMIRTPRTLRLVLYCLALGLLVNLGMQAAQFITGSQLRIQGAKEMSLGVNLTFAAEGVKAFRPAGFLHHPNAMADYLTVVLPIAFAMVFLGPSRLGRLAWGATVVLVLGGIAGMIITLSRGGWISLGVAFIYILFFGWLRSLVKLEHILWIAFTILSGAALVGAVYPTAYLRITSRDARSAESRLAMIDQALLIWRNNPIMGCGLGYYNQAAQTNIPYSFSRLHPAYQKDLKGGVCHCKYLLLAAEQGGIGLALFLALLAWFTWGYFTVKQWPDPAACALGLGLSAAVLAQASFYVFDHFYADIRIFLCWVAFGLVAATTRIYKNAP